MKRHLLSIAILCGFGALFLISLFPVWTTHYPGGMEDTRVFLWNSWWFHYALGTLHQSPYTTDFLYYPYGISLLPTDMPFWNCLVTEIVQHFGGNLLSAINVFFLLSWILAGICTYFLVFEVVGRSAPSVVAGLFIMTNSYTLARGLQNWGQYNLYGIALFFGALVRAERLKTPFAYILAGAALAWTAACHYYFLVYCAVLTLALDVSRLSPWALRVARRADAERSRRMESILLSLASIAAGLAIWIHWGKPADQDIGSLHIGMQSAANPLLVFWVLITAWVCTRCRFRIVSRILKVGPIAYLKSRAWLYGSAFVCLSPLWIGALRLAMHGGYPKQSILWKTHPHGVNLFSFLLPNPGHILWGPSISQWMTNAGLQPQDQSASLGWVCLAVILIARPWIDDVRAKRWLLLAGAASVFSMGTYLFLWTRNLWLPLPFYVLRLMPILGNVRVPERWMAVGSIAWSVVFALALYRWGNKSGKLTRLCVIVGALVLLENWPGMPIVPPPPISPICDRLRQEPPGAVLAMPFIVADSSIGVGDSVPTANHIFGWDHLWAQTRHHHPILGGYIARIPKRVIVDYKKEPFLANLIALEQGAPAVPGNLSDGCRAMKNFTFDYVLNYPASVQPTAERYLRESLPLVLIEKDDDVELYRLNPKICPNS